MIDPKNLRDNLDKIIDMLDKRNVKFPLNDLINLDKKRRELIASLQLERHKKNNIANNIAMKKKGKMKIFRLILSKWKRQGRESNY